MEQKKHLYVLMYRERDHDSSRWGDYVQLDKASGGYPYRCQLHAARLWTVDELAGCVRYMNMFKDRFDLVRLDVIGTVIDPLDTLMYLHSDREGSPR